MDNTSPHANPAPRFKPLYQVLSIIMVIPYATFTVLSRLSNTGFEWDLGISPILSFLILLPAAFLGAYASRKAGYLNMNAVHGIIALLGTVITLLTLIPNLILAVLISAVLGPLMYLLVTASLLDFIHPEKKPGESDITVMSFMFGKHKNLRNDIKNR
jgi:hypothetical protein